MIKTFDFNPNNVGSGHLFPEEIASNNYIIYHGTSSYYSENIEKNGITKKPLFNDYSINGLIKMAKRHKLDTLFIESSIVLNSISFSPLSESCIFYLSREIYGGTKNKFIIDLINKIESLIVLPDELLLMKDKIQSIKNESPVIYGINAEKLEGLEFDMLSNSFHLRNNIIDTSRILYKIEFKEDISNVIIDIERLNMDIKTMANNNSNVLIKEFYDDYLQ